MRFLLEKMWMYPASNYMFKVNNRNTRTRCKMWNAFEVNNKDTRTTSHHIETSRLICTANLHSQLICSFSKLMKVFRYLRWGLLYWGWFPPWGQLFIQSFKPSYYPLYSEMIKDVKQHTQPSFPCSKITKEILKQGVKICSKQQKRHFYC